MASPKYITQLTADDVAKMIAAGNIRAGRGLIIDRTDDGLVIRIDEKAIVDFIWCFIRSGNVRDGLTGATSVVLQDIKATRDTVSLDPNRYS